MKFRNRNVSKEEWRLFVLAYWTCFQASVMVRIGNKEKYMREMGNHMKKDSFLQDLSDDYPWQVAKAIRRVSRFSFWRNDCLPQAVAGKKLLARKGIIATLYLGLKKDKEQKQTMVAHAWLMIGEIPYIGAGNHKNYTVVSYFT